MRVSIISPFTALALCSVLTACGGGGNGGLTSTPSPDPATTPPAPAHSPATIRQATNVRDSDSEFRRQTGLSTIKNEYALALGATGEGVTIGIADTGFDHLHPELGRDKFHDRSLLGYPVSASRVPAPEQGRAVHSSVIDGAAGASHKDLITGYVCPAGGFTTSNPARVAQLTANCQSEKRYIRQPDPDNAGQYDYWQIPNLLGSPDTFHGTAVAGVAVAQRDGRDTLVGVAPDARLLTFPLRLGSAPPADTPYARTEFRSVSSPTTATDREIEFLAPHSQVINFSFGYTGMIHLYTEAEVRAGLAGVINSARDRTLAAGELHGGEKPLYVVGSGNENERVENDPNYSGGAIHPTTLPGLPYYIGELRGRWLAVTAVSSSANPADARITNFANRCGTLPDDWISDRDHDDYAGRHYCLAAPGENIPSLWAGVHDSTGYTPRWLRGTSFASPHVAGALAVLIGHFDTLTLEEIFIRLVDSANGAGTFGDVATYGAGLLDMEAALRPMGEMRAALGNSLRGVSLPLAGSRLTAGAAYGDALSLAFEGRTMAGFDDYHAPFPQPLSALILTPRALSLAGRRDRLASFGLEALRVKDGYLRNKSRHGTVAVLSLDEGNSITGAKHLFMAHQTSHGLPLGLRAIETSRVMTADPSAFNNPFLGLAEQGVTIGVGQSFGDGVLRLAAFTGTGLTTGEDGLPDHGTEGEAHGVVVDYAVTPTDDTSLSLAIGALMEDGQILGLAPEGAFGTPPPVPAMFGGVTLANRLSGAWTFIAQAHGGVARPEAPSLGLVTSASPVIAGSFAAGLTGGDMIRAGDRLSVIISQPLRVEAGRMGLSWATGRTIDGQLLRENVQASLTPSGREITLGVGYGAPLGDTLTTELRAGVTRHPGHDASAKTELFAIADVTLDF